MKTPSPALCPCGSGRLLAVCCGPYLTGQAAAPDAQRLMQSRYCAYVLLNTDYLLATWHPDTRPALLDLEQDPPARWLGLTVKRHEQTSADQAQVAFVARYKIAGRAYRMEETSRFVRLEGRWYYLDGVLK